MSDQFLAEIRIFPFNFAPKGWALCDGQLQPINQNTALFSLLGTQFGGDGITTFALPDLQGSSPVDFGSGTGLTPRNMGDAGGEQTVTLLASQMPAHTHTAQAGASGGQGSPLGNAWASGIRGRPPAYGPSGANVAMSPSAISPAGGSQPHNNLMPYLCLNFCIALQGIFPPRS